MIATCREQWWGIRPMVDHLPAITPHVCQGEPEHNDHHRCQCGASWRNQNRTEDKT